MFSVTRVKMLWFMIGVYFLVACLYSCEMSSTGTHIDYATQQAMKNVPPGATDIVPMKGGWVKYTYEGHRYLFLLNSWGQGAYSAVTRIDWDAAEEVAR